MTKPLSIEMNDAVAAQLAQAANDIGETPEEFVARAIEARLAAFHSNSFFQRRKKPFDRDAARAWLDDLAEREGGPAPDPDDVLPESYRRPG
jgi:predicted transcriptional regulator